MGIFCYLAYKIPLNYLTVILPYALICGVTPELTFYLNVKYWSRNFSFLFYYLIGIPYSECWAYYLFNTLPSGMFVILFKK